MTEEFNSQDTGTNVDAVDNDNQIDNDTQNGENNQDDGNETTKKGKSNVPKILAEKNKWKAEAEKWKAEAESKEFSPEKVEAMINNAIAGYKQENARQSEKQAFISTYGEEHLGTVETLLEQHDTLSYEQAAKLAGIGFTQQSNPNKYSVAGTTPAGIKKTKTVAETSDEDLRASLVADFQSAGFMNAR